LLLSKFDVKNPVSNGKNSCYIDQNRIRNVLIVKHNENESGRIKYNKEKEGTSNFLNKLNLKWKYKTPDALIVEDLAVFKHFAYLFFKN
jgi:hypothetical protein